MHYRTPLSSNDKEKKRKKKRAPNNIARLQEGSQPARVSFDFFSLCNSSVFLFPLSFPLFLKANVYLSICLSDTHTPHERQTDKQDRRTDS
mmetsp:Transcript_29887/g.58627  ORF Transcript_29887/g.58627 Transcript_29887/m.58627 type:complete len:91 (+) Transcript_29887:269-541(+)